MDGEDVLLVGCGMEFFAVGELLLNYGHYRAVSSRTRFCSPGRMHAGYMCAVDVGL